MSNLRRLSFGLALLATAALGYVGGRFSNNTHPPAVTQTPRQNNPQVTIRTREVEPVMVVTVKADDLENRWEKLTSAPATPAGETELAALIEKMARQDPQRAIALATGQANLRLRIALIRAALKGWGATDPQAAVAWAQTQTFIDEAQAINALMQGAVEDPEKATGFTTSLIQNEPTRAVEFGSDLISALTEAGQFERAAFFSDGAAANSRGDLMLAAYSRWAEFQPTAAMNRAMQLDDTDLKKTAMDAVVVGWSRSDPKAMATYAINNIKDETERSQAISGAISYWADTDPVAAADWINQHSPDATSDIGAAEIALSPQLAKEPEVASTWAENIFNPQLRMETLGSLLEKWAALDANGARRYIQQSPVLTADDRAAYLAKLNSSTAEP